MQASPSGNQTAGRLQPEPEPDTYYNAEEVPSPGFVEKEATPLTKEEMNKLRSMVQQIGPDNPLYEDAPEFYSRTRQQVIIRTNPNTRRQKKST